MDRIILGGLPIVRVTREDFAARMVLDCKDGSHGKPKLSFSANGFSVAIANRDREYARTLSYADYIDADGMPLVFTSRLKYSPPLPERIATTDFFHDAARAAEKNGISFFLLGGTPEVNQSVTEKLLTLYPKLNIAGRHHGYFGAAQEEQVFDEIRRAGPDVVWIGMGSPRQEDVALRLSQQVPCIGWIKTCGGLYEHILEKHPRAPRWMQAAGLEWLHRALREPKRLGWRYLWSSPVAFYYLQTRSSSKRNILNDRRAIVDAGT